MIPKIHSTHRPKVIFSLIILASFVFVILIFNPLKEAVQHEPLPDFSSISDTSERKAAFFNFLRPYIDEANAGIERDREYLVELMDRFEQTRLNRRDLRWLEETSERYGIEFSPDDKPDSAMLENLDLRIGKIPASLALAQAALESGWGTSRFAREGNNLFGIWCYEPGCGIVPARRPAGRTYEVARYATPRESFEAYIANLNTNEAYRPLWEIRRALRRAGEVPKGVDLAEGLVKYSQERWTYVQKVQSLIQSNQLELAME